MLFQARCTKHTNTFDKNCAKRRLYPAAKETAEEEGREVTDNDRRADGRGEKIRPREPQAEAHDRERRGKAHNGAETLEKAHGGEGGEDDEAREQHRAHHAHTEHDRQRRQDGEDGLVCPHMHARGAGEGLVKRDGEELVVEEDIEREHAQRERDAQKDVRA